MEDKIKVYTMKLVGSSTLVALTIDEILESLKIELEENMGVTDSITFKFGIEEMSQKDIDKLGEFDGF